MKKKKNLISESGAIMLEVVAVLSLMGLMGAMLFRQMYVRNQELHNIQMASEIRVVKDAFAAWIQAESTRLGVICPVGDGIDCARACDVSDDLIREIKDFLPEGYFSDETGARRVEDVLKENYKLKLIGYRRGRTAPGILTYYGVVIPDPNNTLPTASEDGTWNFRRAARVAMLIGVDGGAYDPTITQNLIAGAVGTWNLPWDEASVDAACGGGISVKLLEDSTIPTYVAITGTDVFQPEIDIPDLSLGLPENWDVAIHDATAYGKFTAGSTSRCYIKASPRTTAVNPATGFAELRSDTAIHGAGTNNCFPAFYVEEHTGAPGDPATGSVHVLNDLTVGREWDSTNADFGKSGMRFDKDGMIVFEKAEVSDPQHPGQKVNYMLDPQFTSVMNDIKLMSRGGANLSDILPNYILRAREDWSCTVHTGHQCQMKDEAIVPTVNKCWCESGLSGGTLDPHDVTMPECPRGYTRAMVVIPQDMGGAYDQHAGFDLDFDPNSTGARLTKNWRALSDVNVFQPIIYVREKAGSATTNTGGTWELSLGFKSNWKTNEIISIADDTKTATHQLEAGTQNYKPVTVHVVIETYCVFDPANIDWNSDGTVNASDTAPTRTRTMDNTTCGRIRTADVCANMGCEWDSGSCRQRTTP